MTVQIDRWFVFVNLWEKSLVSSQDGKMTILTFSSGTGLTQRFTFKPLIDLLIEKISHHSVVRLGESITLCEEAELSTRKFD